MKNNVKTLIKLSFINLSHHVNSINIPACCLREKSGLHCFPESQNNQGHPYLPVKAVPMRQAS